MLNTIVIFVNKLLTKMKDRIERIMKDFGFSATQFANEIGIQRSALSHIMSGRNKPSLDFVIKVKHRFPEISLDWLLLGKGKMVTEKRVVTDTIPNENLVKEQKNEVENINTPDKSSKSVSDLGFSTKTKSPKSIDYGDSEIEKIIFFLKNGTFKIYNP